MFGTSRNLFNMFHVVCHLVYRIYRAKSCFILRVSNPFLCEYLLKKSKTWVVVRKMGKSIVHSHSPSFVPVKKNFFCFLIITTTDERQVKITICISWHGKLEMVDVKIYSNPHAQSFTLNDVFVTVRFVVLHIDTIFSAFLMMMDLSCHFIESEYSKWIQKADTGPK